MHIRFPSDTFASFTSRFACVCVAAVAIASSSLAEPGDDGEPQRVDLSESDAGNGCEMVFGQVGEPFLVTFSSGEPSAVRRVCEGLNAAGEACALPRGVRFSKETMQLSGVPKRPGFYEFVVLLTEKGVTTEKVVLIDIQNDSRLSLGASYASSFLGGLR